LDLKGKNIILGVTGSIAAYKAAILIRLLIKSGAQVKVVMTELAKAFISPLTLATLSKNPILVEFYNPENGDWNSHVDLGIWADALLIAPATANTMAKMATGVADNLLLTTYLSARCPVFVAPAMDLDMYRHQTTQENLVTLQRHGVTVIEPSIGELASGLEGKGRMEDPETIVQVLTQWFSEESQKKKHPGKLEGKKVLITAGPTYESIDAVRFVGNYSSGKMGYALVRRLIEQGAEVYLVSGPVQLQVPDGVCEFIPVQSARQMYDACYRLFPAMDIAILAAAVADYRPREVVDHKIKSTADSLTLELEKTIDIAMELGKLKKANQLLAGFALETENELEHAQEKMRRKNFDLIVLNSLQDAGAGFGYDTNKISIIGTDNKWIRFGLKSKDDVALDILEAISEKLSDHEKN